MNTIQLKSSRKGKAMLALELEVREDLDKVDKEQELEVTGGWGQEHSGQGDEWERVNGSWDQFSLDKQLDFDGSQ